MEPVFFASDAELERWLEANHASAPELLIGFYKKGSGHPSISYSEALDAALCWGWIDGVRRSLDAQRWEQRYSPRRARSIWSRVNIKRAEELIRAGRMRPPGLKAFEARREERTDRYSYEQQGELPDHPELEPLRQHAAAWSHFSAQPQGYRRTAAWWILSAKKPETRARRLAQLIELSLHGQRLPLLGGSSKPPTEASATSSAAATSPAEAPRPTRARTRPATSSPAATSSGEAPRPARARTRQATSSPRKPRPGRSRTEGP